MKNSGAPAKPEIPDLELPDWSGMDRFTPRVSRQDAMLLNEEYRRQYASDPRIQEQLRLRRLQKCQVEFVL